MVSEPIENGISGGQGISDYDAIVIGSGSGGLTAALALAQAGKRVALFERHQLAGGYSQSFELDGFSFSPGIHYIGQLGEGGRLRQIYEGLGLSDSLVFLELDPDGYDRVFIGDERFDIPKGRDAFGQRLKERFPSEAAGIDGYLSTVSRISEQLVWARRPESLLDGLLQPVRARTLLRYGLLPLSKLLDRFTSDPLLRGILSIQAGDHAMAPARAPAALHAGLQDYYFDGGCYPRGGAHAIADAFVAQIELHGGDVMLGEGVAGILVESGRAKGVRLSNGSTVSAPIIVTNTDPGVTWGSLLAPEHVPARLRRRLARMRYSLSTLSCFMAVDMDLRAAGLDSGNVWYSRTTDIDEAYRVAETLETSNVSSFPGLFLNVTTLKDPSLRSDGLHTVEAMALMSGRAFARWKSSLPGHRPPDYTAEKERLADLLVGEIERFLPGFREHIVFRAVGTPLTNESFLNVTDGGIYGIEKTLRNMGPFAFPTRAPIDGLFQCGASTLAPGINGVTRSGLMAAAAALDCEEDDLLTAGGRPLRVYPSEDVSAWPAELRPGGR